MRRILIWHIFGEWSQSENLSEINTRTQVRILNSDTFPGFLTINLAGAGKSLFYCIKNNYDKF